MNFKKGESNIRKNKIYTFEEIQLIVKPIFEKYKIEKAYLFGSYARKEATEKSDIDIMIVKENSNIITLLNLAEFEEELEKALNKKIDIIIKETYTKEIISENKYGKLAKELFYKQIINDMRILYDK